MKRKTFADMIFKDIYLCFYEILQVDLSYIKNKDFLAELVVWNPGIYIWEVPAYVVGVLAREEYQWGEIIEDGDLCPIVSLVF